MVQAQKGEKIVFSTCGEGYQGDALSIDEIISATSSDLPVIDVEKFKHVYGVGTHVRHIMEKLALRQLSKLCVKGWF